MLFGKTRKHGQIVHFQHQNMRRENKYLAEKKPFRGFFPMVSRKKRAPFRAFRPNISFTAYVLVLKVNYLTLYFRVLHKKKK